MQKLATFAPFFAIVTFVMAGCSAGDETTPDEGASSSASSAFSTPVCWCSGVFFADGAHSVETVNLGPAGSLDECARACHDGFVVNAARDVCSETGATQMTFQTWATWASRRHYSSESYNCGQF